MVQFIGQATAIGFPGGDSVTLPAHQAGDIILIAASCNGTATIPSLPAGYTSLETRTATNCGMRVGYKVAASSSETSGTWTNATGLDVHVYRDTHAIPIGDTSQTSGSGTSITYPALTMAVTDGTSWAAGFSLHRSNSATGAAPSGMTNRSSDLLGGYGRIAGHDTNGGVSSWSDTAAAVGANQTWIAVTVEIKGVAAIGGTASITEAADTVAGQGWTTPIGSAVITEADDTVSAQGHLYGEGFIGAASVQGATSITLPTHQAGDAILIFAFRSGSATPPSLPAGWTNIRNQSEGGGGSSFRLGYKIAASGSETSGTWTNANGLVAMVFRATAVSPIGGNTYADGAGATVLYPGVTLSDDDGTSWVATFAGSTSNTTTIDAAPSGQVQRTSTANATFGEVAGFDTNGAVNSWSNQNIGVGGSASWLTVSVEIRADLRGRAALTEGDDTVSATGLGPSGSATITEAGDTVAGTGAVALQGTASIAEVSDTVAGTGAVAVTGSAAVTEGDDTSAGAGTLPIAATGSMTEEGDTAAGAGALSISGAGAIIEGADTVEGEGDKEGAHLDQTEEDDSVAAAGDLAVSGIASATEENDSVSATADLDLKGAANVTESNDTLAGTGLVSAQGALAATEADDTVSASGVLPITASGNNTEAADSVSASGIVTATGSLNAAEVDDLAAGSAALALKGSGAITEADDSPSATGGAMSFGAANVAEASDTVVAGGTLSSASLTSPLALPQFWDRLEIARGIIDLREPKSKSVGTNGKVYLDFEGVARWVGTGQFVPMRHEDSTEIEALLRWLGPGRSFLAYDKRKPFPTFDPDGTKLGSSAPQIASVGGDNTSIAISNLPSFFKITAGDLMSYERANGRRALLQAVETKVADIGGLTPSLQIYPPLRSGTLAGQALTLIKPCAEFILSPDSKSGPNGTRAFSDGLSFEFEESL